MSHRHLIILLGLILAGVGAIEGGWCLILLWPAADFLILGIAHFRNTPGVFGKRADGSLPFWSWLIFLPLLLYTNLVWRIACLLSREPAQNTVTNDLVVGRRLLPGEVVGEFANYIDLTAEFPEPPAIRKLNSYQCFPILDGAAPRVEELHRVIDRLLPGTTFIHCAQGHGRTGTFALAVMLKQGIVANVDEGLQKLQSVRPGIHLSKIQSRCIEAFASSVIQSPPDKTKSCAP
jgi:protein-tyrosine phosphatase